MSITHQKHSIKICLRDRSSSVFQDQEQQDGDESTNIPVSPIASPMYSPPTSPIQSTTRSTRNIAFEEMDDINMEMSMGRLSQSGMSAR